MGGAKLWLALAGVVTALGLAACGGDDGDEGGTTTGAEEAGTTAGGDETGTSAKKSGEPILIKTHVAPLNARGETTGEVLSGSTIGDSAFCAGGRFIDAPEKPPGTGVVVRSFRCPGGTLTITFSATPTTGLRQRGDWKVVKGLGRFEGLSGGGRMRAVSESSRGEGRETSPERSPDSRPSDPARRLLGSPPPRRLMIEGLGGGFLAQRWTR